MSTGAILDLILKMDIAKDSLLILFSVLGIAALIIWIKRNWRTG